MHVPEAVLRGGCLGRFGGELRLRMQTLVREMPEHIAQLTGQTLVPQFHDAVMRAPAIPALIVAVLEQGDSRIDRPGNVVAGGIDRRLQSGWRCWHRSRSIMRSHGCAVEIGDFTVRRLGCDLGLSSRLHATP